MIFNPYKIKLLANSSVLFDLLYLQTFIHDYNGIKNNAKSHFLA